jgi:putative transposase
MSHKAYKTQLKPNRKQIAFFKRHAGCARFIWNWALEKISKREFKPNAFWLNKRLTEYKQENSFLYEVSNHALVYSLRHLSEAYSRFFKKISKYPKFKSKHGKLSFTLQGPFTVESSRIKLPKIGWARLKEKNYLPVGKHLTSVTISERAGKWFVSLRVEEETELNEQQNGALGIDLGVKNLATCSDGTVFANPKALFKFQKKLKRIQRKLNRRVKGSNRYNKLKLKLARLWLKISNIRSDATHKATSEIVRTKQPSIVVLEDLSVTSMKKFASRILDANMREFRRQIEYKSAWAGVETKIVDRYFPSTKMCSKCGKLKDLKLSERIYKCSCGLQLDRDLNASINLKNTAELAEINARGVGKVHANSQVADVETRTSIRS